MELQTWRYLKSCHINSTYLKLLGTPLGYRRVSCIFRKLFSRAIFTSQMSCLYVEALRSYLASKLTIPEKYSISSSAVAKRLRDASCLSVVSFNSTKRRAQSIIVSYRIYTQAIDLSLIKCCSFVFGVSRVGTNISMIYINDIIS